MPLESADSNVVCAVLDPTLLWSEFQILTGVRKSKPAYTGIMSYSNIVFTLKMESVSKIKDDGEKWSRKFYFEITSW